MGIVTDPDLLAKLNGTTGKVVSDPALLAKLNGVTDADLQGNPEPQLPIGQQFKNIGGGVLKGIDTVGQTLNPYNWGKGFTDKRNAVLDNSDEYWSSLTGANPKSGGYKAGTYIGEAGAVYPVGPILGVAAKVAGAPEIAAALRAGGFADLPGVPGAVRNVVGGSTVGATGAGLINPTWDSVLMGATVGAGLPFIKEIGSPIINAALARFGNREAVDRAASNAVQMNAGSNKDFAINAMDNAKTYVPGATPTVEEALAQAQPPGGMQGGSIVNLQRSLHGAPGAEDVLGGNVAKQNQAIIDSIAPYAGGNTAQSQERALEAAKAARGSSSGQQYRDLSGTMVKTDKTLNYILSAPSIQKLMPLAKEIAGNEASAAAAQGLKVIPSTLTKPVATPSLMTKEGMSMTSAPAPEVTHYSIQDLQYIKQALDKVAKDPNLAGSLGIDATSLVKKGAVRDILTKWMENAAPEWAVARDAYKAESLLINQLNINKQLLNSTVAPNGDLTPNNFLNAYGRGQENTLKAANVPGHAGNISSIVTPENTAALEGVNSQLQRQAVANRMAENLRGGKPADMENSLPSMPHVGHELMLADYLRKGLTGKNVSTRIAQSLVNPADFAKLLRGVPRGAVNEFMNKSLGIANPVIGGNISQ